MGTDRGGAAKASKVATDCGVPCSSSATVRQAVQAAAAALARLFPGHAQAGHASASPATQQPLVDVLQLSPEMLDSLVALPPLMLPFPCGGAANGAGTIEMAATQQWQTLLLQHSQPLSEQQQQPGEGGEGGQQAKRPRATQ